MKCGIDPGRHKIGFALAENGALLFSAIVPKEKQDLIASAIKNRDWLLLSPWREEGGAEGLEGRELEGVFIGNGTTSRDIKELLVGIDNVRTVNEYGTTLKGRALYWRLHPTRGLWRLVPLSLRTPPRPVDDLAAWAITGEGRE